MVCFEVFCIIEVFSKKNIFSHFETIFSILEPFSIHSPVISLPCVYHLPIFNPSFPHPRSINESRNHEKANPWTMLLAFILELRPLDWTVSYGKTRLDFPIFVSPRQDVPQWVTQIGEWRTQLGLVEQERPWSPNMVGTGMNLTPPYCMLVSLCCSRTVGQRLSWT